MSYVVLVELLKKHSETYSGIALSTGNLNGESIEWLDLKSLTSNLIFKRDTGFIIKLYQDFCMSYDDMPKELEHIIQLVISAGFTILEFDADAPASNLFVYYGE